MSGNTEARIQTRLLWRFSLEGETVTFCFTLSLLHVRNVDGFFFLPFWWVFFAA